MKQCLAHVIVLLFITLDAANGARYVESKYNCPKSAYTIHPCKCLKATDDGLTITCNNTHLASLSVALANIGVEKTPIDDLLIERSHFAALFGTMFFNLMCRKIIIRNTPIERIDDYIFNGVNDTLEELEIYNSKLTYFPKAFKMLGKLTTLTIDTHNISQLEASAFADGTISGKLERLHITNGNISDISIEFLQSLRKLKTLDFHGNHIKELKRNQFKNLRDLEVLDISHNELKKLDSSHIADLTKLGWCNVSHNAINEITRGTFARNSVLRVLNMSNNNIKRLDSNSFRGMRFLRRLFLSDNMISDVGRGTFTAITRIGTIDLARNQIKKVDYQMFSQLNYVEVIDLAENKLTEVQRQSFKDLYLTKINMSHNAIEKFEAGAFENCVNMTYLDLSYNSISSFARGSLDELSYATEFLLSFNLLTNMSAIPLSNMTGLKILNVSHNQIVDIPKNTFPKLYELHTIDLSHNNLMTIFNSVFQTLFSFRSLNMSWNKLNEIKSSTFGTLPTLLELNMNNNELRTIARGALTKLSSLRSLTVENNQLTRIFDIPISLNSLHLRNNQISEISLRTWPTMNSLIELDLRDNMLENRLSSDSFNGLMALRYLKLSNNGISIIPRDSFAILSTLQFLYLDGNNITDVPTGAFGKLPVVFELNLHNNQISNISSKAFDGLLQLLKLNMSMNNIRSIPSDAFTGLVSLRSLDLSYNQLKKLDNRTKGVLDDCLSLEKINLSHNKFSFITKETFPSDPYIPYRLREIDLSYNEMPVLTYDLAFGTHKVKFLNLSHNSINEIRRNVLSNLTQLETLDISFNELETLESDGYNFTLPKNLTHLYISNNKLWTFPVNIFDNLTTVQLIDIENNSIEKFDLDLLKSVKTGLQLQISGNPLNCDCHIRPLSHYYQTVTALPISYTNIICNAPELAANRPLHEINDDNLICTNLTETMIIPDLDVLPDLMLQEIFFSRGNLTVRWIASPIKKDIAGFYIVIRNLHNRILTEYHLPYDKRIVNIFGNEICDGNCNNLELCALSKDSNGIINAWFDSQCIYLPNDIERIRNKYNDRNNQIFVIHSIRKQIRAKSVANRELILNDATKAIVGNMVIFQCVILSMFVMENLELFA